MSKTKTKTIYVCNECGAQRPRWEGQCRECGTWGSLVEELQNLSPSKDEARAWVKGPADSPGGVVTQPLSADFVEQGPERSPTGLKELDRVLGGGLVPGSFVLLGGDPGIGKSTLLMQTAGGLAQNGKRVLYVSAEESINQTGLRAQRLGVRAQKVEIASESNLEQILILAQNRRPDLLIVDSIQTVFLPALSSAPGTVSQVRESAARLMGLAKGMGISVFLIGHVTKEGTIAGPKVLEHMVDTVLSFEGDPNHHFRLLRALKNRFGATHELGVFEMVQEGLREVPNPSELFLAERGENLIGSTVFPSMEGSRPLLCEIQALTTYSALAMPRRTSTGFDVNRVHLLVGVLSKHLHLDLGHSDIFINVVGGLKIIEPAADLAVAAALISSEGHYEIPAKACFFGEVGLTGEVRAVAFAEIRVQEAQKLGFETFVLPLANRKHFQRSLPSEKVLWVQNLHQLRNFLGGKKKKSPPVRAAQEAEL